MIQHFKTHRSQWAIAWLITMIFFGLLVTIYTEPVKTLDPAECYSTDCPPIPQH